jgi:hypothetical protein
METYQQHFTGKNPNLLGFTITGIATGFKLRFKHGPTLPPKEALNKILSAVDRLDEETFEALCLKGYKTAVNNLCQNSNDAWMVISELLSGELRRLDVQIYPRGSPHPSTILPKTYRNPETYWGEKQKITPRPAPTPRPSPTTTQKETIVQFITRRAPSINYLQGFIVMSRHTNNRLSRRGKKVFKRSNENPDLHKSATWYVCTSWKQSAYFRDPQRRRPKKGSPRSRKK